MNTDKHRLHKTEKIRKIKKNFFVLSVFICVHLWLTGSAFSGQATPSVDSAMDAAAKGLEQAKDESQKLKDDWDKARLETTLYDQRAKRAYQKWAKAAKAAREQAKAQKERTELELQLAIEKRKLAYDEWQAAELRVAGHESQVKALDQEKEGEEVRDKIRKLQDELKPSGTSAAVSN